MRQNIMSTCCWSSVCRQNSADPPSYEFKAYEGVLEYPRDVKENRTHRTRQPLSTAPRSSSEACVPIVGAFGGGQRLSLAR